MASHRETGFTGSTSALAIVGASLFWLWMDSAVFSNTLCALSSDVHTYEVMFIVTTLVSVAVFAVLLKERWGSSFFETRYRRGAGAAAAVGSAGSFLLLFGNAAQNPALLVVGSCLCGAFFSYFNVLWGWVCVAQGHAKATLHIAAAWALTLPGNLLFSALPPVVTGSVVSLLPVLSGVAFAALMRLQNKPALCIEAKRVAQVKVLDEKSLVAGVDVRLLLLILVFCAVFGLMYFKEVLATGSTVAEGGIGVVDIRAITALVFFIATLTVLKDRVKTLFKTCFYVLVAGLALLVFSLFVPELSSMGGSLIAVGYCGFDILVWTMVAFHGYVSGNAPQKTVVVTMLAEQLGILIGAVVGMVLQLMKLDVSTEAVMMMTLNLLAIAVLVAYTEYGSQMWSLLVKTSLAADQVVGEPSRIAEVAARYKLTQREQDVLAVFAQGRSMGYIAEKMFVSENTIKTHVRHIYAKCGVRGKQELLDLVQGSSVGDGTDAR